MVDEDTGIGKKIMEVASEVSKVEAGLVEQLLKDKIEASGLSPKVFAEQHHLLTMNNPSAGVLREHFVAKIGSNIMTYPFIRVSYALEKGTIYVERVEEENDARRSEEAAS